MRSLAGTLAAPFPYFGGKSMACASVWSALGDPDNYVEAFAGSAAMLLGRPRPNGRRVETINDADGFVANFWRAVAHDAPAVARWVDWPVTETDLFARHSWLVRQRGDLTDRLHGDPEYYDPKIAGWWCWGACSWIGSGWCSGDGPWVHDGITLVDQRQRPGLEDAGAGVHRKLPALGNAGRGVHRQLPALGNAGRGVHRQLPALGNAGCGVHRQLPGNGGGCAERAAMLQTWFGLLMDRLRHVRVAVGDWRRVLTEVVTVRHGTTGIFLDPPYTRADMDYAVGGVGGAMAGEVRAWCAANGGDQRLRIVLCGHAGEHDALCALGWSARRWVGRKGMARSEEACANVQAETLWCSPHCVPEAAPVQPVLFSDAL